MTAKDLKNALLQEAVQGKLVPQIASEGNARDLLEEIRKERLSHGLDFANAKSRKRKSKKETALAGSNPCDIADEEIPFDIPESWCWCRLGEIIDTNIGLTYSPTDIVQSGGIAVLRSNNIQNGEIVYNDLVYVSKTVPEKCMAKKGDLLICARNGSRALVGKCAIIKENGMSFGAFMALIRSPFNSYIMNFINSPLYRARLEGVNTTTINQITQDNLKETLIPLPPLAEQKRIVAAIEKFMPLIEEYGKKETELKAFNEQIGAITKKAILQEAVQGKLVPQIASEGNAKDLLEEIKKEKAKLIKEGKIKKEKTLPEISDDEIPFDIPENWCWCRLGEIIRVLGGVSYDKKDVTKTGYRILRGGNIQQMKILLDETDVFLPEKYRDEDKLIRKGDILIVASTGSKAVIGKAGFVDLDVSDIMIGAFLRICRPYSLDMAGYLRCLFESDFYRKHIRDLAQGTNINNVKESYITEFVIPLPPLAEQKRIVVAIEKMLPLCEKLGE